MTYSKRVPINGRTLNPVKHTHDDLSRILPAHFVLPTEYAVAALGLWVTRASSETQIKKHSYVSSWVSSDVSLKKDFTFIFAWTCIIQWVEVNCSRKKKNGKETVMWQSFFMKVTKSC